MKSKVKLTITVVVLFLLIAPTFISEVLISNRELNDSISCDSPINREDTKYTKPIK